MRLRAIICDVLSREFYHWAAESEHVVDIMMLSSENHDSPEKIHTLLQRAIDDVDAAACQYDFLLLGFGLCGKVLEGLHSGRTPIVIPRVHDCIRLFLGPGEKNENLLNQGTGTMYYIGAWLERYGVETERKELQSIGLGCSFEEFAARYGEENAAYLIGIADEWKNRYSRALYVVNPLTPRDFSCEIQKTANQRNWSYQSVTGDSTLIRKMVFGEWPEEDFQIVEPWCKIQQSYDRRVIGCVASERRPIENGISD